MKDDEYQLPSFARKTAYQSMGKRAQTKLSGKAPDNQRYKKGEMMQ